MIGNCNTLVPDGAKMGSPDGQRVTGSPGYDLWTKDGMPRVTAYHCHHFFLLLC